MSESGSVTFPLAQRIDVGFDLHEDRLLLIGHTVEQGSCGLWMTRRLLRSLLEHYCEMLRTSSEDAALAPRGYGNEVLRMEHVRALESGTGGSGGEGPKNPPGAQPAWFLATEVTLQQRKDGLLVCFTGMPYPTFVSASCSQRVCALLLDRVNAHKVLALLCSKAQEANWGAELQPDWLDNEEQCRPNYAGWQ